MADDLVKGYRSERRMSCHDRLIGPITVPEYEVQEAGRDFHCATPKMERRGKTIVRVKISSRWAFGHCEAMTLTCTSLRGGLAEVACYSSF
jgi:hypothetical protein